MGKVVWVGAAVGAVVSGAALLLVGGLFAVPPLPALTPNPWWGAGERGAGAEATIREFVVDISKEVRGINHFAQLCFFLNQFMISVEY